MDAAGKLGHTLTIRIIAATRNCDFLLHTDKERISQIVDAAQATRAEHIVVYDMQNRSAITDYVLICSGRSQAHVRGISDRIEESLRERGVRCGSLEGYQEGSWVLLDYGMVIVHVFHPETREYYDLDDLLKNCPAERFTALETATA